MYNWPGTCSGRLPSPSETDGRKEMVLVSLATKAASSGPLGVSMMQPAYKAQLSFTDKLYRCFFRGQPQTLNSKDLPDPSLELQWPIDNGSQCILNTMSPLSHNVLMHPMSIGIVIKSITCYLGWSCWSDEDFVGRVSRASRRCHPFLVVPRTIARCLAQYRRQWRQFLD